MNLAIRLLEVRALTARVKAFRFEGVDGLLPPYSAGSSVRIRLPVGGGRSNAYSLTGDPGAPGFYEIAVRKEDEKRSRGGSLYLHNQAKAGDTFEAGAPENHFPPIRTARHHVLLAAGIGITPFLSYIPSLTRWRASYEIHYSYRGEDSGAFRDDLSVNPRATLYDSEKKGRMPTEEILNRQAAGAHVYVCGPHDFIRTVRGHAGGTGWPESCVHYEQFTPAESAPGHPFLAKLARSGKEVAVGAGESLLEALEKHGVDVPSSCRVGGCGTCKVGVIRGQIDHRDVCLPESEREENRSIITCISRSENGELVLDL